MDRCFVCTAPFAYHFTKCSGNVGHRWLHNQGRYNPSVLHWGRDSLEQSYGICEPIPGLDSEAKNWILAQGVVNLCTDAPSTDNPADITYPNHTLHDARLVIHTEMVANIPKIPRHDESNFAMFPLRLTEVTGCPIRAIALWED